MSKINKNAINKKLQAYMDNDDIKERAKKSKLSNVDKAFLEDGEAQARRIGEHFIDVLHQSINSASLSTYAEEAVSDWEIADIESVGNNKDKLQYIIHIRPVGDLSRPSLKPQTYDGIDDIVDLINNGQHPGHTMGVIYGVWPKTGKRTSNINNRNREGAHFIEDAIHQFQSAYGKKYHISSITTDIDDK